MIRLIAATATAVLLLTATPAGAAAPRRSELTVSYLADAGYAAAVKLRCNPAGGAHPKKGKACQALARPEARSPRSRSTGAEATRVEDGHHPSGS